MQNCTPTHLPSYHKRTSPSTGSSSKAEKFPSAWEGVILCWKCYLRGQPMYYGPLPTHVLQNYLCTKTNHSLLHHAVLTTTGSFLDLYDKWKPKWQTRTLLFWALQKSDSLCPEGFIASGIAVCRCCCNTGGSDKADPPGFGRALDRLWATQTCDGSRFVLLNSPVLHGKCLSPVVFPQTTVNLTNSFPFCFWKFKRWLPRIIWIKVLNLLVAFPLASVVGICIKAATITFFPLSARAI